MKDQRCNILYVYIYIHLDSKEIMSDRFAKGHGTSWDTATPNIQNNAGAEEFVTRTQGASDLELESLGSALFTHSNYIGFVLTKMFPTSNGPPKLIPKVQCCLANCCQLTGYPLVLA